MLNSCRTIEVCMSYCMDVYHIYVMGVYVTSVEFKMHVVGPHENVWSSTLSLSEMQVWGMPSVGNPINHLLGMAKIYPTNVWQTILHDTESV